MKAKYYIEFEYDIKKENLIEILGVITDTIAANLHHEGITDIKPTLEFIKDGE